MPVKIMLHRALRRCSARSDLKLSLPDVSPVALEGERRERFSSSTRATN